jgi:hypothetical protein
MLSKGKARRHAKQILHHIEKESGYSASKDLRAIVIRNFTVTIRAHGEVSQSYINSLVRVFRYAREERQKYERTATRQELSVLSAS